MSNALTEQATWKAAHPNSKEAACLQCGGTGKITVSYASAENGPTDDPADETGIEYCECPVGHDLWYKDAEESEAANTAFFLALQTEESNRTPEQAEMVKRHYEDLEAQWEVNTHAKNI